MNYEIKLATVVTTDSPTKQGSFQAKLIGSSEIVPVVMTTPVGSQPVSSKFYSHAGLFGNPTLFTQVLIKKIDDSGYWYFDGVPANTQVTPTANDGLKQTVTNAALGSLQGIGDAVNSFSHSRSPQKYGLLSPQGNKLVLSDAHNQADRELYASLESKTGQKLLHSTSTGISSFKNSVGDGITIRDVNYNGQYAGRAMKSHTFGNMSQETTHGQMTVKVGSAGRVLDIVNEAIKDYNTVGVPSDNDVGAINLESFENDITIKVNSKDSERRVFIDAAGFGGLVQIRAGKDGLGGVEILCDGDINVNCTGEFNVKAGGNINMKGSNIHLNPDFDVDHTFAKSNKEIAEDSVQP
jgi:hypothetical protein